MKTEEDEAFDELAKRQGAGGRGYQAKRKMAMDKYSDIVSDGGLDPRNKMDAQPAQEPSAQWLEDAFREGWESYRDSEFASKITEDWAFGNSIANGRMIDLQQNTTPPLPVQPDHLPDAGKMAHVDWEIVAWHYLDDNEKNKIAFSKNDATDWGSNVRPLVFGDTPPLPVQSVQPAQEPTALQGLSAYLRCEAGGVFVGSPSHDTLMQWAREIDAAKAQPTQRPWVGLTDEEVRTTIDSIGQYVGSYEEIVARKIETKIKELNT